MGRCYQDEIRVDVLVELVAPLASLPFCHVDVMEYVMLSPERTHWTCSHLVSTATKPQQLPPPCVFSERPRAYQENKGKSEKSGVWVIFDIQAVVDNKVLSFSFYNLPLWLTAAQLSEDETFSLLQRLRLWETLAAAAKTEIRLILLSSFGDEN